MRKKRHQLIYSVFGKRQWWRLSERQAAIVTEARAVHEWMTAARTDIDAGLLRVLCLRDLHSVLRAICVALPRSRVLRVRVGVRESLLQVLAVCRVRHFRFLCDFLVIACDDADAKLCHANGEEEQAAIEEQRELVAERVGEDGDNSADEKPDKPVDAHYPFTSFF
jgi:hypothetical protein